MKRAPKLTKRERRDTLGGGEHDGLVTHEPPVPVDWPDGHVRVELTDDDEEECIQVWIHGRTHHLHSTTARELQKMLHARLAEWNEIARAHGMPPV